MLFADGLNSMFAKKAKAYENGFNVFVRLVEKVWVFGLIVGVFVYIYRKPDIVTEILNNYSNLSTLYSFSFIVVAKLFCILLVSITMRANGKKTSFTFSWYAYSISDLSKYLPGGIWSITGRIVIYKKSGMDLKCSSLVLLYESVVLLISFIFTGAIFVCFYLGYYRALFLLILSVYPLLFLLKRCWHKFSLRKSCFMFFVPMIVATCVGMSFFILLYRVDDNIFRAIAAFDLAFAAGQLAIFAPSGVGVREFVVGMFYANDSMISIESVLKVAVVHRLVWVLADIFVALPVLPMRRVAYKSMK